MISSLVPFFYLMIFGVPVASVTASFLLAQTTQEKIIVAFFAPVIFSVVYIFTAGMLSRVGKRGVVPGIFPRDVSHPVYGLRRLYGSAWTAVYYFTPVYFVALSVPPLKRMLFRLFGYQFDMGFTIYPDTWLRDLTCVKFEAGAYIANKATVGTNICLSDGRILVDRVKVGEKSVIGHGVVIGPGSKIEKLCEVGIGSFLGIRSHLYNKVKVGGGSAVGHGAILEDGAEIENYVYVGTKAKIGRGVKLPSGISVPAGAQILSQEDLNTSYDADTSALVTARKNSMKGLHRAGTQQSRTRRSLNSGKEAG